jgi:hypothetical protein
VVGCYEGVAKCARLERERWTREGRTMVWFFSSSMRELVKSTNAPDDFVGSCRNLCVYHALINVFMT